MAAFGKLILQSRNCGIEDLAVTVDDGFGLEAVIANSHPFFGLEGFVAFGTERDQIDNVERLVESAAGTPLISRVSA